MVVGVGCGDCGRSSELSLIADQVLLSNPVSGQMITKDLSCSGRKYVKGQYINIIFFPTNWNL